MHVALEYVTYVVVAVLLGALAFATSTLLFLSLEGAKHLVHTSREVADSHASSGRSNGKVSKPRQYFGIKREPLIAVKYKGWPRIVRLSRRGP